jgi:hypothetical protein
MIMTDEIIEEEQEKKGVFSWLASKFGGKKEEGEEPEAPQYKRRLFDGRIEKYLDQNLDSYISEYGIVTELDLQGYEQRYQTMTGRVKTLKEFMLDSDAVLGQMEKEMELIGKGAKKAKK